MPNITEIHLIDITPEKFLEACSPVELREVDHLIQSPRFRMRMDAPEADHTPANYPDIEDITEPNLLTCH